MKEYECDKCEDTGYYSVPSKTKGHADTTYRCECYEKIQVKKHLKNSGLGSMLENTINGFEVTYPHQKNMKNMAIEYVTSDSRDWFVMLGASGSGKTMLCSAVAKTFIDKGLETKYIVWTSFVKELMALMFQGKNADARALDRFKKVPILYIDDFLKGKSSEYTIATAFDLLNYRVINNLTTIISSELAMKEMLDIDEAVASRINHSSSGYVMEIPKSKVSNYRMMNNNIRVA